MSDRMKELYAGLAKCKAMRAHAEECGRAISRKAGEWLPAAETIYKRLAADEGEALAPHYNERGALRLARGIGLLRQLRDGA